MGKETRKLTRTSKHSYSVTIPKEIVRKYKWREKQVLVVKDKGRGVIVIRDRRKK